MKILLIVFAAVFVVSLSPVQALETSRYGSELAGNEELNEQDPPVGYDKELCA